MNRLITYIKEKIIICLINDSKFLNTLEAINIRNMDAFVEEFIQKAFNNYDETFSTRGIIYITECKYLTEFIKIIDETDFIIILNYNLNYYRHNYGVEYQLELPITKDSVAKDFLLLWSFTNRECIKELIEKYGC